MDNQDKLAKRMLESNESLSVRRDSPVQLNPLEQLIAKVQVRWPFPEMGDLEYVDWRETLNLYPLNDIQQALDRLMRQPPRRELHDGTVSEYRGRPTLVDVTRTIDIMREERAQEFHRKQAEAHKKEMAELQRRKNAGEKFYGFADVLAAANISEAKQAVKETPQAPEFKDIDLTKNAAKLEQQKRELTK